MAKHLLTETSTQVTHPGKATLRTAVAYVLAAIAFLTAALPIIKETMGGYLPDGWAAWLTAAVAFLVALAAAITRVMALARAQGFLTSIGLGAGVQAGSAKSGTRRAGSLRVTAAHTRIGSRPNRPAR